MACPRCGPKSCLLRQEALEERPGDYLIAATPDAIYNGLICAISPPIWGGKRVFQISPGVSRMDFHHGLSRDAGGRLMGERHGITVFSKRFIKRIGGSNVLPWNEALFPSIGVNTARLDLFYVKSGVSITILLNRRRPKAETGTGDLLFSFVPQNLPATQEIAGSHPRQKKRLRKEAHWMRAHHLEGWTMIPFGLRLRK